MKNGGGHFARELSDHFELESGVHCKIEIGWSISLGFASLIPKQQFHF